MGLTDATVKSATTGTLGVEYFITPTVALGPSLFYTHYDSRFSDFRRYGMSVNLGVYL